ncbi:hypothetical protein H4R18_004487 [Coemansia javaensis]|uniref:DNA-binding TFAR19-related protein n=1 Tax=Coemansia javaensis TaxID=2761396 RepID=A0A9W8HAL2_9FUNG|nr:hypothetical protein H4R18_004487 [Coemansia javaensis]
MAGPGLDAQQVAGLVGGQGAAGKPSEAEREREEARSQNLERILTKEARLRLANMAIVKGGQVRMVEDMLLSMAAARRITRPVTEDELKSLLQDISSKAQEETKIVYNRKGGFGSDDDDDDDEYNFD